MAVAEVDWANLDKVKFFGYGTGLFSCVSASLYPVSLVKTRIQVAGAQGANSISATVREVVAQEGVLGLWRGVGTVLVGIIPVRVLYLSTLEFSKTEVHRYATQLLGANASPATLSALAGATGGLFASLAAQTVAVPVDVISQRMMVQGQRGTYSSSGGTGGAVGSGGGERERYRSGLDALRKIVRAQGVAGLYRGFGTTAALVVPSSSVWWGSYGFYHKQCAALLLPSEEDVAQGRGRRWVVGGDNGMEVELPRVPGAAVQSFAGLLAGITSATITTPLDVIKTRLQVAEPKPGEPSPSALRLARQLVQQEGAAGLMKGVTPRILNVSIWSTAMITVYEFLKRISVKEPEHLSHAG